MLRIANVIVPLDGGEDMLLRQAARLLKVDPGEIRALQVVRRAVDARRGRVRWCLTIDVLLSAGTAGESAVARRCGPAVRMADDERPDTGPEPAGPPLRHRPVVVGAGPAGIFAALRLAEYGYRPLILERGPAVPERARAIDEFLNGGSLNSDANIQFGEGGAGTWSDGKLTTRIRDPLCRRVLDELVSAGAPADILTDAKPHIGTDVLREVVVNVRHRIEALGGTYRFGAVMDRLIIRDGHVAGVMLRSGEEIPADAIILAIGHSARDTVASLHDDGVEMESKAFAVGVRIEHPQSLIDHARYGKWVGHPALGAADYHLKAHVGGRSIYSFCMCPGGVVVNASSEEGMLCVNGMSVRARDGENANATLVCAVSPRDWQDGPLGGIEFQRGLERAAYLAGGGGYHAPAQRLCDFMEGRASRGFGGVKPTVQPGAVPADLTAVLPAFTADALRGAMAAFDRQLKGFLLPDAVLTAAETRTSSPVRMVRGDTGESLSLPGLYPAGEGAGYAGGILSAAVDGMEAAGRLMASRRPTRRDQYPNKEE